MDRPSLTSFLASLPQRMQPRMQDADDAAVVVHDLIRAFDPRPLQDQLKHDGERPEVAVVGHMVAGHESRQHLEYLIVTAARDPCIHLTYRIIP